MGRINSIKFADRRPFSDNSVKMPVWIQITRGESGIRWLGQYSFGLQLLFSPSGGEFQISIPESLISPQGEMLLNRLGIQELYPLWSPDMDPTLELSVIFCTITLFITNSFLLTELAKSLHTIGLMVLSTALHFMLHARSFTNAPSSTHETGY